MQGVWYWIACSALCLSLAVLVARVALVALVARSKAGRAPG
jgi:hypothetical protein